MLTLLGSRREPLMLQTRIGYELAQDDTEARRLALIVLRTDRTIEGEVRSSLPTSQPVSLYHSRIFNDFEISAATLEAMSGLLQPTAALIPAEFRPHVVGYGCTSATMLLGEERVASIIRQAHPGVQVTEPVTACIAACRSLGMKKIKLVTPYESTVNRKIVDGLRARGLDVDSVVSFEEPDDLKVGAISTNSVVEAAVHAGGGLKPDVDGVFISCTTLPSFSAIPIIERLTGKPATSSNHALAWHMQKLAGIKKFQSSLGRLYAD
ncbi:maleate isomerase [Variovorax paradoxus]|uniref:Maleate isomerase n=2 Tax=Variovorax paradoxus TaxID=34073 RepID=A0A0H2LRH8_VARPD|nr:maleate isomerase [Variovorax paradoxus]